MARVQILMGDVAPAEYPQVTFSGDKLRLNRKLVDEAGIDENWYVIVFVDDDTHTIWLTFEKDKNKLKGGVKLIKVNGGLSFGINVLIAKFSWIKKVVDSEIKAHKRFKAEKLKKGKEWRLDLIPNFEHSVKRTDDFKKKNLRNKFGVYRYIDSSNNTIVYIGRGNILDRLTKERSRKEWVFDLIQFSYIEDEKQRELVESYWINQFKSYNNNKRPKYNKQDGSKLLKLL
jgi:hypothetical protein